MMHWTNKSQIERDLWMAQGFDIPAGVEGTVGAGEKPPAPNIVEETEEEFFQHCCGDGEIGGAPDLVLIKEMLNMVRDINISSDEEVLPSETVVISKLNPETKEFVPKSNEKTTLTVKKPKRCRNFAVQSLLDNLEKEKVDRNEKPLVLLEPSHFLNSECQSVNPTKTELVTNGTTNGESVKPVLNGHATGNNTVDKDISDSIEKVNSWLKSNSSPEPSKVSPVYLNQYMFKKTSRSDDRTSSSPLSSKKSQGKSCKISPICLQQIEMFRKKPKPNLSTKISPVCQQTDMFKRKSKPEVKPAVSSPPSVKSRRSDVYVPSELANEYYQKYKQRNELREQLTDDVWTKAEKAMKALDDKRRREAEEAELAKLSEQETVETRETEESQAESPQDRHLDNDS